MNKVNNRLVLDRINEKINILQKIRKMRLKWLSHALRQGRNILKGVNNGEINHTDNDE